MYFSFWVGECIIHGPLFDYKIKKNRKFEENNCVKLDPLDVHYLKTQVSKKKYNDKDNVTKTEKNWKAKEKRTPRSQPTVELLPNIASIASGSLDDDYDPEISL